MRSPVGKAVMVGAAAAATLIVATGVAIALRPRSGDVSVRSAPVSTMDPWAWQKPDADGKITYHDIYSMPVPAGVTAARVSSDKALDVAKALQFGSLAGGEPRVTLRLASRLLDGKSTESYQNRLAWIVEYPDSPMILSGPPGLSEEQRAATLANGVCEFVVVIDATTAEPLTSMQVCRRRS